MLDALGGAGPCKALLRVRGSGVDTGIKKIPGSNAFDPGISLFYPPKTIGEPSLPREQIPFLHSGRSSDSRIILLTAPSRPFQTVDPAAFVPDYSGGPVPDLHRVPFSVRNLESQYKQQVVDTSVMCEQTLNQMRSECQAWISILDKQNRFPLIFH